MLTFTEQQIKQISDELDSGFRAFYHKLSGELMFVPDMDKHFDMDTDTWKEELAKLKKNFSDYHQIEAMDSRDSLNVMADFAEEVSNENLRNKLFLALNGKSPFRVFKYTIDDSGEDRQNWFDFKNKRYIEWVEEQIKTQQEIDIYKNANR